MKVLIIFYQLFLSANNTNAIEADNSPSVFHAGLIFDFGKIKVPEKCNEAKKNIYVVANGDVLCSELSMAFRDNCTFKLNGKNALQDMKCILDKNRTEGGVSVFEFKEEQCPRLLCSRGIAQFSDFTIDGLKSILGVYINSEKTVSSNENSINSNGKNKVKDVQDQDVTPKSDHARSR